MPSLQDVRVPPLADLDDEVKDVVLGSVKFVIKRLKKSGGIPAETKYKNLLADPARMGEFIAAYKKDRSLSHGLALDATGKPVDDLSPADNADLDERIIELYKGKQPGNHMENFFQCVEDRQQPIADVVTHHRTMTSCHLCNISLMLGRTLQWDPEKEVFVGDDQATALMSRTRRAEYAKIS